MKKKFYRFSKMLVIVAVLSAMLMSVISCASSQYADKAAVEELIAALENQSKENSEEMEALRSELDALKNRLDSIDGRVDFVEDEAFVHQYDFYLTVGTLPTLYATLNAYNVQNPNTYMWFERGNTISYEYSADFIHYFPTQSQTNANSSYNQAVIREKVEEIIKNDSEAKFHLYCDDLRVAYILNIFVRAGVDFENMQVTFLSDGTATYSDYAGITNDEYASHAAIWEEHLTKAVNGRTDASYVYPYNDNGMGVELRELAYYLSTLSNVELWVQHPDYLKNDAQSMVDDRDSMKIIKKAPKELYDSLSSSAKVSYRKAVLANALVDNDELNSLEDAVAYFDSQLSGRDKDTVLILGTSKKTLEENKPYFDATIEFYTPTVSETDATKVFYKGKTYTITEGQTSIEVDGKTLNIGELGYGRGRQGQPRAYLVWS